MESLHSRFNVVHTQNAATTCSYKQAVASMERRERRVAILSYF